MVLGLWGVVFDGRYRVRGPGSRVQGSGFRVQGSGFRAQGLGSGISWRFSGSG